METESFKKFLELISDILEVDSGDISMDMEFRSVDDWSSMMGFSIIIMLEQEYGVKVSVSEFLSMKTVGELYERISK